MDGVKTGHTGTAGYVLVGAAGGPLGARVISVVLGEPSEAARDSDSLALLRYGLAQFRRVQPLDESKPVASAAVKHFDERASLVPENDALVVTRRGQRVRTSVDAPEEVEGELPAGHPVGRITVLRGDQVVRRVTAGHGHRGARAPARCGWCWTRSASRCCRCSRRRRCSWPGWWWRSGAGARRRASAGGAPATLAAASANALAPGSAGGTTLGLA